MNGKALALIILAVLIVALPQQIVRGMQLPRTIGYQGYLKDSAGKPVTTATYLTFRLYSTTSGVGPVWGESRLVTPDNGTYAVNLGETAPLTLSFDRQYFFGVQVELTPELRPLQQLNSVPYALQAAAAPLATTSVFGNVSSAFRVTNTGSGPAIKGVGSSGNYGALGWGAGVYGASSTSDPGIFGKNSGSGIGIEGVNSGTGVAGMFTITNPANSPSALTAQTSGNGPALSGTAAGVGAAVVGINSGKGSAASFSLTNAANNSSALTVDTVGGGPAARFTVNNSTNSEPAVVIESNGAYSALSVTSTGPWGGIFTVTDKWNSFRPAVFGSHWGAGEGVRGESVGGAGVFGLGENNVGINGYSLNANGIYGFSETKTGVVGESATVIGVQGVSTSGTGVDGKSSSGIGAKGLSTAGTGVDGTSTTGYGVQGKSANNIGVYGETSINTKHGVMGYNQATKSSGQLAAGSTGVVGTAGTGGVAGYFTGTVQVNGLLTKSSGSFKIDHPLDPKNKYLYHSFVESPDMKNIYDGIIALDEAGAATVELPEWFESLNRDFRYQLTCVGGYAPVYVSDEISGNRFRIAGGRKGLKVSWQVTGIRKDAWAEHNRITVEEEKPEIEKGTCMFPEACR